VRVCVRACVRGRVGGWAGVAAPWPSSPPRRGGQRTEGAALGYGCGCRSPSVESQASGGRSSTPCRSSGAWAPVTEGFTSTVRAFQSTQENKSMLLFLVLRSK